MQTPYWLFTCFAQWNFNNEIVDCRNKVLIRKENNCKRKARAKFRSGPHWEAGWIHSFARDMGSRYEVRSANTAFAPTVSSHYNMMCSNLQYSHKAIMIVTVILVLLVGCNRGKQFDSNLWKQKEGGWWTTDVRENMVTDLIESDTLIGLKWNSVIELLGEPERSDSLSMVYVVREKYGRNIDPEYILDLILEYDESRQVIHCKLEKK